jgi:hypothetical protein
MTLKHVFHRRQPLAGHERSNVMTHASLRGLLYLGAFGLVLATPLSVRAETIGTSCADCPSYKGAYLIANETGETVRYQYRWGQKSEWKRAVLQTGRVMTHSYPIGESRNGKAPSPYVRFDNRGGDGQVTMKEYDIDFMAVGYAGYGSRVNNSQPKKYFFRYARNGRDLDLFAK